MQAVVEELYSEDEYIIAYPELSSDGTVELVPCGGYNGPGPMDGDELMDILWSTANIATFARRTLQAAGYPPSIRNKIASYEEEVLAELAANGPGGAFELEDMGLDYVAFEATLYKNANMPDQPEVTAEGRCGGYVIEVVLDVAQGARLWMAGEFSFRLCARKGIDPWDVFGCSGWYEETGKQLATVAGSYRYVVDWEDGEQTRSKVAFTYDHDGATFSVNR